MIRKAVIPAAGFGTRFLPATKSQPKEMLPIVDTPVIQYVVEEAVASGITDILMVIGKGKRAIEEHFDRNFELEAELSEKGKTEELELIRRISDLADVHFVWQKELSVDIDIAERIGDPAHLVPAGRDGQAGRTVGGQDHRSAQGQNQADLCAPYGPGRFRHRGERGKGQADRYQRAKEDLQALHRLYERLERIPGMDDSG